VNSVSSVAKKAFGCHGDLGAAKLRPNLGVSLAKAQRRKVGERVLATEITEHSEKKLLCELGVLCG